MTHLNQLLRLFGVTIFFALTITGRVEARSDYGNQCSACHDAMLKPGDVAVLMYGRFKSSPAPSFPEFQQLQSKNIQALFGYSRTATNFNPGGIAGLYAMTGYSIGFYDDGGSITESMSSFDQFEPACKVNVPFCPNGYLPEPGTVSVYPNALIQFSVIDAIASSDQVFTSWPGGFQFNIAYLFEEDTNTLPGSNLIGHFLSGQIRNSPRDWAADPTLTGDPNRLLFIESAKVAKFVSIPEPSTMSLVLLSLVACALIQRNEINGVRLD